MSTFYDCPISRKSKLANWDIKLRFWSEMRSNGQGPVILVI